MNDMNKIIFILSLLMLVTACGTRDVIKEVEKKVPVYMVPEPPTIERPELPIHSVLEEVDIVSGVTEGEDAGKIAKAYVVSLRLAMNWGSAMDRIIYAYKKMSERDFSLTPLKFSDGRELAAEPSRVMPDDVEKSDSDFATLKNFADTEFDRIIDKYEYDKELILEEYNASESDQETE